MTAFNTKQVDHTQEYMFFGEPVGVARYDKVRYKKFDDFVEQQLSYFWRPDEVGLTRDINDFQNKMTERDKDVFVQNLQYQILLDSVQGRSPVEALAPLCSLPELEGWLVTWAFSETIHSRSYTHIIRNIFNDPSEVFDNILISPEIMRRAQAVTKYYDALEDATQCLKETPTKAQLRAAKEALFYCMVSVYVLEAIRFYVSFACSYSFAERGLMDGNAKIIQLINRDEFLHQGSTHFILTRWLRGLDDPEMTEIATRAKQDGSLEQIFIEAAEQECAWADHLMKDGNIPGLSAQVLKEYVDYLCNKSLSSLDISSDHFKTKICPLPWIEARNKSWMVQVAPQETELSSYMVGAIDMESDISDISLD